ncbi:MAG: histidine kinase [Eubacteriales bacterium]
MKKNYKIKTIIAIPLSILFLVFIVLQSIYIYHIVSNEIEQNVLYSTNTYLDTCETNLNQYLDSIERLAVSIELNKAISNQLNNTENNNFYSQYLANENIADTLETLSFSYSDIVGIVLVTNGDFAYNYNRSFGLYEKSSLINKTIINGLNQDSRNGYITTTENDVIKNSSVKYIFTYYKNVYKQGTLLYTICIFIDSDVLGSILPDSSFTIFSDENVVYPSDYLPIENKEDYLFIERNLSNNWQLVYSTSNQNIQYSTYLVSIKLFLSFIYLALFILMLVIIISKYIAIHLHSLETNIVYVGSNSYEPLPYCYIKEINSLNDSFSNTNMKITQLLSNIENEKIEKEKNKLELLQAQINPHFLYNTLDAINWMALDIDAYNISEMLSLLADLFRYGLNNGNELSTIKNEIAHLTAYIAIQQYRYNNRFTFSKSIDNSLLEHQTLNIILQPLVENSLLHGFRSTDDTIEILLTVQKGANETIEFIVSDTGIGCNSDFMNDYLGSSLNTTKSYGVKNIQNRLKLYFGSQYGVEYIPCKIGTKVKITIPSTINDKEASNV